ncbi:hypothetical protein ACFFMP_10455 [Pseudoroseomonas cervicalis]|uniref:hypothetical protein n=1 Tax=Teichococcus cervicalis TaxID=204525 RepID=UPI0012F47E6C|nr:hypothetical protein [Pseudoroseomonas cervicalis]
MCPPPGLRWLRWAGVAAGLGFLLSLPVYAPGLSAALLLASALLLGLGARRRLAAAGLVLLSGGVLLAAGFGTTTGYFWLNRPRLEALLAEIAALPAITSLELGQEGEWVTPEGERRRYDSYRFLNGQAVTQHRRQVAPGAAQPVRHEADLLRELGVPPARYLALRASLHRLSLSGFDRGPQGEVVLNQPSPGGTPWVAGLLHRPADGPPAAERVMERHRLAPRWFWVVRG